jgi:hypothetical protein
MSGLTFISQSSRSPWLHLLGGPILWILHFLIGYVWVEFACRMNFPALDSIFLGLSILSWSFLIFTIIVTLAVLYIGWLAFRNWQTLKKKHRKAESTFWEIETREFMSLGGVVLSVLFSLTILVSGLPVLALDPCSL